ncbi:MAG: dihydroorotase [Lentisphaerae bacterium]|nr:dihydroorotase [Lentisphaerota bacterium]
MNTTWLLKNGLILDPHTGRRETGNLLILNGIIADNRTSPPKGTKVIDATGYTIVPGFIDLHVHLRDPGRTEAESIQTGAAAAARGGFTRIVAMPNTMPPIDSPKIVNDIKNRGLECGLVKVDIAGCLSKSRNGVELADLKSLAKAKVAAFSDDGSTLHETALMSRAAEFAVKLGLPILDHALDPIAAGNGVMREGVVSQRLGLPGIPAAAEILAVRRDIDIAYATGCAMHIQHVSTAEAVELIRDAKHRGISISGEATPHHITFTDEDISPDNTNFKINPPLGSSHDREAIINGVADGTLQILATDHAPHTAADKATGFLNAPFGVTGLETAVGATFVALVHSGKMSLEDWVRRWTVGPATVIGIQPPTLTPGTPANITVLDLTSEYTLQASNFLSKSANCLFTDTPLIGHAVFTFCEGRMTWHSIDNPTDQSSPFNTLSPSTLHRS